VPTVLSHRRPTSRTTRSTLLATALAGVLALGLLGAPAALAKEIPKIGLGPSRTVYSASLTSFYAGLHSSKGPVAGAVVTLEKTEGWGWRKIGTARTSATGQVWWFIRPQRNGTYRMRYGGSSTLYALYSNVAYVRVKPVSRGAAVVQEASRHAGKPYQYGAAGPNSFDCSGFTLYVFSKFGKSLPHGATAQVRMGTPVSQSAALPGDLVAFPRGGVYGHIGIYAGGGYMWDSSTYGRPVAKRKIYRTNYVVRRIL